MTIAMRYRFLPIIICLASFLVIGCSSKDKGEVLGAIEEAPSKTAAQLYQEGAKALEQNKYREAMRLFGDVERQYPYSKWATKAQLMAGFAAYEGDNYDEAILAIDRFIELHPGNDEIDYAYYLRALAFYEQISNVARDQGMTEQAMRSFDALITRFPESEYARDAKLKRDLTLDHLAGKEMEIGRYYLNRNQVNAAINRFQTVVKDYQTTAHAPEALHRLVEAYLTIGLRSEATSVAAVLGHNYPGSKWYQDTYKIMDAESRQEILENRSFVDKTVDSLFKPD